MSLLIMLEKTRKLVIYITIFTITLLLFYHPRLTKAATILFQDNFDSGNANNWIIDGSPGWQVISGEYGIHLEPGLSNTYPSNSVWSNSWNNYDFQVDFRGVYGTDKNIAFRYNDSNNFYEIHHSGGTIHLEKHASTGNSGLSSISYPLSNGITYHVEIKANGNNIQVTIDGNPIFNITDNTNPILQGRIALRAGTGAVSPTEV